MRKVKPLETRLPSVTVRPVAVRPLEDGVMTRPIPPEQRDQAHEEMRSFIKRHRQEASR